MKHVGKYVGVFVRIYMRDRNSGRLDLANLGLGFLPDFILRKPFSDRGQSKILQAAFEFHSAVGERWNMLAEGLTINQHNMAAGL